MDYLKRNKILQVLLIISMVILPVTSGYAMALMDSVHVPSSQAQAGNSDKAGDHGMTMTQHDQASHHFNKCCPDAACNPVPVTAAVSVIHASTSATVAATVTVLTGIDLPVEIKPPRSFPG